MPSGILIQCCAAEHQTLKRGLILVLSSSVPPIIERISGYRSRVIDTADPQVGQKWRHSRFLPSSRGLIGGEVSLNRHCISWKNDSDQKRRSRLTLATIALAKPDGYRFALVPIPHCTAEAMTRPPAACWFGHWRFSYFPFIESCKS